LYFENTSGRLQHPTDIHTFPFLTFFCHFQVVSERLFSTPQSSSSSLTGSSDSQGPLQPQEPHYRAHGPEEDITQNGSSDDEFSDDEMLKMLRQQAGTYREQLQ